jgi:hypothetical protein
MSIGESATSASIMNLSRSHLAGPTEGSNALERINISCDTYWRLS